MKENGFRFKKKKQMTETMRDVNSADTPAQVESLMNSMEQAAGSIGCCMNANKTIHVF